jgi:transposase
VCEISTIGIDLAKSVFQVHGADRGGTAILRKKLRRDQVLAFFASLPRCVVAMEACASAHYWARQIAALGHDTRLIPPAYVKPFVKRQKNDMADAEAICEAAQLSTMRFVQGKSAEAQASAVVFRTRDILVRQRTQLINALRGHLTEFGYVVRQGVRHVGKLVEIVGDPASDIPAEARPVLVVIAQGLQALQTQIALLDREIAARAKADPVAQRLMRASPYFSTASDRSATAPLASRRSSSSLRQKVAARPDSRPRLQDCSRWAWRALAPCRQDSRPAFSHADPLTFRSSVSWKCRPLPECEAGTRPAGR